MAHGLEGEKNGRTACRDNLTRRLYQNLVCSAAFALGGLLGREWPGVDLDDGGVDWTMEAEDDLRSGEAPSDA